MNTFFKSRKIEILTVLAIILFVVLSFGYYKTNSAHLLHKSEIITKDEKQILMLKDLSSLAEQDVPNAQGRLAQEYYDGVLIEQNDEKALFWAEKGHTHKDPLASLLLAKMYFYGEGVVKDKQKAISLMEEVVDKRKDAQYILGRMYLSSSNNPESYEKGIDYIKKAADDGMPIAQYDYARALISDINFNNSKNTEEERFNKKIEAKSAEYLAMAVTQGYAPATRLLAIYFNNGIGVERNIEKSKDLMALAVKMGDEEAKQRLESNNFNLSISKQ